MQPEWNNICWYIQEAHAILRPKSSGIFNFNLWIYTVFVQWGAPFMRCVVAGRGSRCTKTALRPGCTSLWVLTLTPCFSLLSACISCCQAIWPREEVGGARSLDALRWSQGFFLFRRYCGTDCKCTFVRGDDILGRRIICSKRCWMLEELLWARASRSTAGSRADWNVQLPVYHPLSPDGACLQEPPKICDDINPRKQYRKPHNLKKQGRHEKGLVWKPKAWSTELSGVCHFCDKQLHLGRFVIGLGIWVRVREGQAVRRPAPGREGRKSHFLTSWGWVLCMCSHTAVYFACN